MKSRGRGRMELRILSESPAPAARDATMAAEITEHPMRFLSWKTACAAALSAPLLALAQQPSDYARGAIVLAHGLGVHPDYGLIGELRARLADAGYTTLSIQMPVLAADAPAARYPVLFWEADARFAGAVSYLWRKDQRRVVLLSHSMGSRMANHYISSHPQVPLAGWISLSISSGEFAPLKRVKFPVYDVYAEKDYDVVLQGAQKRAALLKRVRGSSQTMMFATDHFFAKREKELVALIRLLLEGDKR